MSFPDHPLRAPLARVPLLLMLGALLFFSVRASGLAAVEPGKPFPDPSDSAYALEGTLPSLAGQVVLVDFWATWCGPCKASFPAYDSLQTEFAARGFTVLGVSVDKKAAPYAEFLKRLAPTFPTLRDAGQKLVAEVRPPAMPTCYLLDRKGLLRLVHSGFHGPADLALLRAEILKLLDEKP